MSHLCLLQVTIITQSRAKTSGFDLRASERGSIKIGELEHLRNAENVPSNPSLMLPNEREMCG